jgi:hypothetical protein
MVAGALAELWLSSGAALVPECCWKDSEPPSLCQRVGLAGTVHDIAAAPRGKRPVLSYGQQHIWLMEQIRPGTAVHTRLFAYRIQGDLDVPALRRAVHTLVQRHETFRTRYPTFEGKPYQLVDPGAPRLRVDDLSKRDDPLRTAAEWVAAEARDCFDLAAGPLFRARLLRAGPLDHVLVLTFHRSVFDARSLAICMAELSAAYALLRRGMRPTSGGLPVQYADFAAWQRDRLSAGRLAGQLAYWRRQLAHAPETVTLPADRPRPERPTFSGGAVSFPIDGDTVRGLRQLVNTSGSSPRVVTLAAFQALLAKHSGATDLIVGVPVAGRNRQELQGIIGNFVNLVPVRVRLAGDPTFAELVGQVRETVQDGMDNCDLAFEQIVEEVAPARQLGRNPVLGTSFSYLDSDGETVPGELSLPGLTIAEFPTGAFSVQHDLEVQIMAEGGALTGTICYQRDMFDEITMSSFAGHYADLLRAVTRDSSLRLSRLPLVTDQETAMIAGWNDESEHV